MGVRIVPKSNLELKLQDKGFQQKAIKNVESMRPTMKKGGKVTKAVKMVKAVKVAKKKK